eukprot:CAMPEP_0175105460 /NCGR_PEP_ID=MMETSP0086_2-20121207/10473_1 /TAXON_ID=136419 /ORGANISM="Unknown Unknown, Strain D1" /LENGTH=98 /DNA_ID=CAMNT_0016381321 /DNA_START=127 /DNA_END=423 /DNA_ORIENTATION=+
MEQQAELGVLDLKLPCPQVLNLAGLVKDLFAPLDLLCGLVEHHSGAPFEYRLHPVGFERPFLQFFVPAAQLLDLGDKACVAAGFVGEQCDSSEGVPHR